MKPVDQPQAVSYTAAGCDPLPVVPTHDTNGAPLLISAWELSAEEVVDVLKTGRVWLLIRGTAQPPVRIVTRSPFEEATEP